MESQFKTMLQALAPLAQQLPVLDTVEDPDSSISDALATILIRLRRLEQHVVAEFSFGLQSLENDIKDYTALLLKYQDNVYEKIDFIIDMGHVNGGWDKDIAMDLEETLSEITLNSNYVRRSIA